jgi:hypothetical protein
MKVTIKVIPHTAQRYETVGDWEVFANNFEVKVSRMTDWRYEWLVGIHEAIEAALCNHRGITDADVSAFDVEFEAARAEGNTDEPGDHPDAPYRKEHLFATGIEKLLAAELGVNWKIYDEEVNAL